MQIKHTTIYICDHCRKIYLRKQKAYEHQERCYKNPENHPKCLNNCEFFQRGETFRCTIKNVILSHPIADKKGLRWETPETYEVMPTECEQYKFAEPF